MSYLNIKELTKEQVLETKGIAILFMLLLHLFCNKNYSGLYEPLIYVGKYPLIYYLALFGDCCVAIYCFCSGYGLMYNYQNSYVSFSKHNLKRVFNLYLKFWVIFVLFVILIGTVVLKKEGYPGSLKTILLTLTGLSPGYNGAWWFFTTYIFLIITSKKLYDLISKYNSMLVVTLSFIFYFFAYIQRIKVPIVVDSEFGNYFLRQLALYGTSLFPFVVGAVFQKEKIYSRLSKFFERIKWKNFLLISVVVLMIILHGFVETLFVAVFTGIVFICCYNLLSKGRKIERIFQYFGKHSTNLWLIHMFFYMIFFEKYIFVLKYPVLIYLWLILICLIFSYIINFVEKIVNNISIKF